MKIFGNYSLRSIKTHSYFVKLNNFSFGAKASGNQAQAQGNKQAKQEPAPLATKVQGTGQPKKSAPVQKEALPYKPLDQMTKEERLIKGASAKKEVYDHFGGKQYLDSWKKAALWEVIAKKKRRIYLNTADNYIDNCKLIINAKRMRTLNDNYLDLALRKNEIVVVIKARDNYPEVQIVCDLSQLHRHFARRYCTSRFYHFKLPNGEEIKCLLDNFEQHYCKSNF